MEHLVGASRSLVDLDSQADLDEPDKLHGPDALDEPGEHRSSVTSRVLAVLGTFSVEAPHLRGSEIARLSGLPPATTNRLLKELLDLGAVERVASGKYAVGARMWEIGVLGSQAYRLWSEARPHVEALARDTGHRAHLSLLSGLEGLRLEGTSGRAAATAPCWVIERLPLHATAAGQVLLAFGRPELLEQVLRRPLTKYTSSTICTASQLTQVLNEVRRGAVAVSRNEYQVGRSSIAAPVLDVHGHAIGAVEVAMSNAPDNRQLVHAVVRSGTDLSRRLDLGCTHVRSRVDYFAHPAGNRDRRH